MPPWITITSDRIRQGVAGFPKASAGGGSELTPTHLQELLSIPTTDDTIGLVGCLTKLVNHLATGDLPSSISPWLAGPPLTALKKRGGGFAQSLWAIDCAD